MLRNLLKGFGRRRSSGGKRRLYHRPLRLGVEALERRQLLSVSLSLGGTQSLMSGTNINVSNDSGAHQSEMILDVNPSNPLNLAGFSHRIGSLNEIDVFYSTNGGAGWGTTRIDHADDGLGNGMRFDPSIAFDADGNLFIGYGHKSGGVTKLVVARSTTGGASFSQFTVVENYAGTLDKWHLATGYEPDSDGEAVYVAYTRFVWEGGGLDYRVAVAGSRDAGLNWTNPVIINDEAINGTAYGHLFADPAVGPDGELYVSWHDIDDGEIQFDADTDGLWGDTNDFGNDVTVVTMNTNLFKASVPAQPSRGIHTGPVLDVDRSGGTYDGRLYLVYVDTTSQGQLPDSNIYLRSSDNDGASWSAIRSVETCDGTDFLPWVDVDQTTGSVNVIYYTTDNDTGTGNDADDEVDVRVASSFNGGTSFPSKTDLTTAMSCAEESGYSGDFLEYIGLAVHDGTIHGLWSDNREAGDPPEYQDDQEAYTANASFSSSSNANVLTVTGDDAGVTSDNIVVRISSTNSDFLEVLVNSDLEFAGLAATIDSIVVNGVGGNDTIDLSGLTVYIPTTLYGGDGNDSITGSGFADFIYGQAGHDVIGAGAGNDYIYGGEGNDTIDGEAGADKIYGEAGNDSLTGGTDSDTYYFTGSSPLGNDTITETSGTADTLSFTSLSLGSGINLDIASTGAQTVVSGKLYLVLNSGTAIERVYGTSYADTIRGNSLANYLTGSSGNDTIYGRSGADTIYAGSGNDTVHGEGDNDTIYAGDGDDTVYCGSGNDLAYGDDSCGYGAGDDNLHGDDGNDTLYGDYGDLCDNGGDDNVYGGYGSDTLFGEGGNDYLFGGEDDDNVYGGYGSDSIYGQAGQDYLYGEAGNDTIRGGYTGVGAYGDYLYAGDGNDTAYGDDGMGGAYGENDWIDGGSGNDYAYGEGGSDTLVGGTGNDYLDGGYGGDTYRFTGSSNLGTDSIYESSDSSGDSLYFYGFAYAITVDISSTSQQTVASGKLVLTLGTSTLIENVYGTNYADTITGNSDVNYIYGYGSDDTIDGGAGNDRIYGGDGSDTMYGGYGSDILHGGDGNDTMYGGLLSYSWDEDELYGEDGNDTMYINDGQGNDKASGGSGTNTVTYDPGDEVT